MKTCKYWYFLWGRVLWSDEIELFIFWHALFSAAGVTATIRWWRTLRYQSTRSPVLAAVRGCFKIWTFIISLHSKSFQNISIFANYLCLTSSLHENFHSGKTILRANFVSPWTLPHKASQSWVMLKIQKTFFSKVKFEFVQLASLSLLSSLDPEKIF